MQVGTDLLCLMLDKRSNDSCFRALLSSFFELYKKVTLHVEVSQTQSRMYITKYKT